MNAGSRHCEDSRIPPLRWPQRRVAATDERRRRVVPLSSRDIRRHRYAAGVVGGSAIALRWLLSSDLRATQCGAPSKPQPTTWNGRSGIWRHNYSVRVHNPGTWPCQLDSRCLSRWTSPRLVYHCNDAIS